MPSITEAKKLIASVAKELMADLDSAAPTVAAEIVWSYQDSGVQDLIAKRLAKDSPVASVRPLLPDIVTGYRRVHIVFASPALGRGEGDGVLIQIDGGNKVREIIDPFRMSEEKQRMLTEQEGTFLTSYSSPLARSGFGADELNERFERFVREEGVGVAFSRLRNSFGSVIGGTGPVFADFASGTCVITTRRIPTMRPPGTPDPFPGTEGTDAEEQEDDNPVF